MRTLGPRRSPAGAAERAACPVCDDGDRDARAELRDLAHAVAARDERILARLARRGQPAGGAGRDLRRASRVTSTNTGIARSSSATERMTTAGIETA